MSREWRLDLPSLLHETNQLTISAGESSVSALPTHALKKYKKKKVHDDRKRSMNFSADDFDIPKTTASSTASLRSKAESDGEENDQKVRKRRQRNPRKMKIAEDIIDSPKSRCRPLSGHFDSRASSETDNDSYQADAEMGGMGADESDYEPVFDHVVDFEMMGDSTSSFHDDSSHSESNNKDEGCEGDDELTDVEGVNVKPITHASALIRSRLNATGAMPARQLHQISAIVENSSWNHIKANRFPGLVARSIRTRLGSRRRPKLKTVQSCQNPTDSEPYDFSHISLPKVSLSSLNSEKRRRKTSEQPDRGESSGKMSRDSF